MSATVQGHEKVPRPVEMMRLRLQGIDFVIEHRATVTVRVNGSKKLSPQALQLLICPRRFSHPDQEIQCTEPGRTLLASELDEQGENGEWSPTEVSLMPDEVRPAHMTTEEIVKDTMGAIHLVKVMCEKGNNKVLRRKRPKKR